MRRLLLAAGCLLPLASRAQTAPALPPDQARVECRYRLTYRPDSTTQATRTEQFRLRLGSKVSCFESKAQLFFDSAATAAFARAEAIGGPDQVVEFNLNGIPSSSFVTRFKEKIYKIPTASVVAVYDAMGTSHYVYQEPATLFTWAITPTTATVAGYACQRATTTFGGRTWEAWFTRTVPISDGPYKFSGLPGLIVQVGDTRGHYLFELTQLRQLAPPVAFTLPEASAKPIAKADFVRGKTDYDRTAMQQMLANGNLRFNTPEEADKARQKAQERAKRKTNPLELKQ